MPTLYPGALATQYRAAYFLFDNSEIIPRRPTKSPTTGMF